jgi:hypothetical protein
MKVQNNKLRVLKNIYNIRKVQYEKVITLKNKWKIFKKIVTRILNFFLMKHQNSTHIFFKHILSYAHIMELNDTLHLQNQN